MSIFKTIKIITTLAAAASLILPGGCAKETSTNSEDVAKSYIDAWMSVYHPGINPTGDGIYILDDNPGSGAVITDDDYYLFVNYTQTDLDGNISATTYEDISKRIGSYKKANYYGSDIILQNDLYTQVGVLGMVKGMKIGGTRTALVPSWLNVTTNAQANSTTPSNAIYTVSLVDKTSDITAWEIDTLQRYVASNMERVDSTFYGYYCKTYKEPTDTATFNSDTTFWINYTGRLLNGHVFDTNVEDTAKVYGIYSPSRNYSPTYVTPSSDDDYTNTTIAANSDETGTTVVKGFAYCLSKLRPFEKVRCAFYSELGYGYSGSGTTIPRFAPIVFDIEVVDSPED